MFQIHVTAPTVLWFLFPFAAPCGTVLHRTIAFTSFCMSWKKKKRKIIWCIHSAAAFYRSIISVHACNKLVQPHMLVFISITARKSYNIFCSWFTLSWGSERVIKCLIGYCHIETCAMLWWSLLYMDRFQSIISLLWYILTIACTLISSLECLCVCACVSVYVCFCLRAKSWFICTRVGVCVSV